MNIASKENCLGDRFFAFDNVHKQMSYPWTKWFAHYKEKIYGNNDDYNNLKGRQ